MFTSSTANAVPLPRKDSEELGVRSEELQRPKMEASLHIIGRLYCLLPFKYRSICYPVSGLRSLLQLLTPHSSLSKKAPDNGNQHSPYRAPLLTIDY